MTAPCPSVQETYGNTALRGNPPQRTRIERTDDATPANRHRGDQPAQLQGGAITGQLLLLDLDVEANPGAQFLDYTHKSRDALPGVVDMKM